MASNKKHSTVSQQQTGAAIRAKVRQLVSEDMDVLCLA